MIKKASLRGDRRKKMLNEQQQNFCEGLQLELSGLAEQHNLQ